MFKVDVIVAPVHESRLSPGEQEFLVRGLEARSGMAAEIGKFIDNETRTWSALLRGLGLKGE